jgi:hypothetical protein
VVMAREAAAGQSIPRSCRIAIRIPTPTTFPAAFSAIGTKISFIRVNAALGLVWSADGKFAVDDIHFSSYRAPLFFW